MVYQRTYKRTVEFTAINNMREKEEILKELEAGIPEDVFGYTILMVETYVVAMKHKFKEENAQIFFILSAISGVSEDEIRFLDIDDSTRVANRLIKSMSSFDKIDADIEDYRIVEVDGTEYGLVPNFDKIETGAYIDLLDLLKQDSLTLHKIMAILYRPVITKAYGLYTIERYSTEGAGVTETRAALFAKHLPYKVVVAVVNFMLRYLAN